MQWSNHAGRASGVIAACSRLCCLRLWGASNNPNTGKTCLMFSLAFEWVSFQKAYIIKALKAACEYTVIKRLNVWTNKPEGINNAPQITRRNCLYGAILQELMFCIHVTSWRLTRGWFWAKPVISKLTKSCSMHRGCFIGPI